MRLLELRDRRRVGHAGLVERGLRLHDRLPCRFNVVRQDRPGLVKGRLRLHDRLPCRLQIVGQDRPGLVEQRLRLLDGDLRGGEIGGRWLRHLLEGRPGNLLCFL